MIIIRQFQQENLGREFRDHIWTSWGQFKGDTKRRLKLAFFLSFFKRKCANISICKLRVVALQMFMQRKYFFVCVLRISAAHASVILGRSYQWKTGKSGWHLLSWHYCHTIPPFWHDVTDRLPNTTRAAHVPCLKLSNVDFFSSYNFMFCCCCFLVVKKKKKKKKKETRHDNKSVLKRMCCEICLSLFLPVGYIISVFRLWSPLNKST